MGLEIFGFLHPLGKTTDTPPSWAIGREFQDGLGNTLMLVLHRTPTTGVAVSAGSPVGWTDGYTDGSVTTDLSQSDIGKLAGMSMVAITAAESLAATTYAWVMTKGNPADYISGGRGVPLGDSDFNPNVNPITSLLTDGSVADASGLYWQADNTWGGITEPTDGMVLGGVALGADVSTALAAASAKIQVGIGMGYTA